MLLSCWSQKGTGGCKPCWPRLEPCSHACVLFPAQASNSMISAAGWVAYGEALQSVLCGHTKARWWQACWGVQEACWLCICVTWCLLQAPCTAIMQHLQSVVGFATNSFIMDRGFEFFALVGVILASCRYVRPASTSIVFLLALCCLWKSCSKLSIRAIVITLPLLCCC